MDAFLSIAFIALIIFVVSEIVKNIDEIMNILVSVGLVLLIIFLFVKGCSNPSAIDVYSDPEQQELYSNRSCEPVATPESATLGSLDLDQYKSIPDDLSIEARFAYLESMMSDVQSYMNNGFHLTNESIRNYHEELMKGFSEEKNMLDGIRKSLDEERVKLQQERENQFIGNMKMMYMGVIAGWIFTILFPPDRLLREKKTGSKHTFKRRFNGGNTFPAWELQVLGSKFDRLDLEVCSFKDKMVNDFLVKLIKVLIILVFSTFFVMVFEYSYYYFR